MAASSPLKDCVDEITKCSICLDDFDDPKSLPCLHTFCLRCIEGHCGDKSSGDQVHCPICRSPFVIPLPGVGGLHSNFFIRDLIEAKAMSERRKKTASQLAQTKTGLMKTPNHSFGITRKRAGDRTIIEYKSTSGVLLSTILPDLRAWRRAYDDVTEVRILCCERLTIDCDLENSEWHGINIVIVAIEVDVICICQFDVSGLNAPDHVVPAASGEHAGEDGEPGQHGGAGESGGNVMICCSTFSGKKLRVRSHGGDGGRGQDGGDGRDGEDGADGETLTADKFKRCFPTLAKFDDSAVTSNAATMLSYLCSISSQWATFNGVVILDPSEGISLLLSATRNWLSRENFQSVYIDIVLNDGRAITVSLNRPFTGTQCYVMYRGGSGNPGYHGGSGGKGGQGGAHGLSGSVLVLTMQGNNLRGTNIYISCQSGSFGLPGRDGRGGKHGKDGCNGEDHGYVDWIWFKHTRYYRGDNLLINYCNSDNINSVWCSHHRRYVHIFSLPFPLSYPSTETGCNEEKISCYEQLKFSVPKKDVHFGLIRHDVRVVRAKNIQEAENTVSLNEHEPILGISTLNDELYVRYQRDTDLDITVYDAETYDVRRSLRIPRLSSVKDMASCERNQCIYIADRVNNVVHRVDNNGTIITQWPVYDEPQGLCITPVCNVLVTYHAVGKIREFTTDGKFIRGIVLQSDVVNPLHAVELANGHQIVVCHGLGKDPLHRVCLVDSSGRVIRSYGGSKGSGGGKFNTPMRLAASSRFVFVADCGNHRVVMLSRSLDYVREVTSDLRCPVRIWLDECTCRLYVADNKIENGRAISGHVTMFSVGL